MSDKVESYKMQACGPPPEQCGPPRTVPGLEGSGSAQDAQTPAYYPNIEISTTTVGTQTNWDDIELEKAKRDTELRNNRTGESKKRYRTTQ
ncbi:hypothetical protein QE152_g36682 [Popillia japonica]|uniref:Uncharacterized protein n=1 Tax=Popillia japonica TaxID=7064 RepID=A0AAW1ICY7_POPJA